MNKKKIIKAALASPLIKLCDPDYNVGLFIECAEKAASEGADIIVFPEACDVPCLTSGKDDFDASVEKYGEKLFSVASETAKRCNAIVFANGSEKGIGCACGVFSLFRDPST